MPARGHDEAIPRLTAREREVLEQIAAGRSNREIAVSLTITERTIESHARSIYMKLGVRPGSGGHARVQATLAWQQFLAAEK